MTNVTSLSDRRRPEPEPEPDLAGWVERADAEVERTARNPNDVLIRLLAAGCKVAFSQPGAHYVAEVTMPDGSVVSETGVNPVAALVFAYGAGAWLAGLPAALAATAEA